MDNPYVWFVPESPKVVKAALKPLQSNPKGFFFSETQQWDREDLVLAKRVRTRTNLLTWIFNGFILDRYGRELAPTMAHMRCGMFLVDGDKVPLGEQFFGVSFAEMVTKKAELMGKPNHAIIEQFFDVTFAEERDFEEYSSMVGLRVKF